MPGSDFGATGGMVSGLARRANLGWAGLVLLLSLTSLLSAGYKFGVLGDWKELLSSLTSAGGGNTDSGEPIDSGARQFEASRFSEQERADSSARASVAAPVEAAASLANPPATASDGTQVERLMQLMEQSEATWAEGYNAERERADGIARDLATVRAELTDRVAAEGAARAEVARIAKLLEVKEAEWGKRLAAGEKSKDVDSAARVRTDLADHATAEASARVDTATTTNTTTGSAMTRGLKTVAVPDAVRSGRGFTTIFGFARRPRSSTQVAGRPLPKHERHGSTLIRMGKDAQKRPLFARTPSFGFF